MAWVRLDAQGPKKVVRLNASRELAYSAQQAEMLQSQGASCSLSKELSHGKSCRVGYT